MQFACRGTFLFWLCERETQIDEIAPAGGKSFITKWREMPHLLIMPLQYARRWHSVACLALFRPDRRPHRVLIFRRAAVQMRSWGTHHSTGNITLMLPVQSSPKERALGCVSSPPQPADAWMQDHATQGPFFAPPLQQLRLAKIHICS